MTIPTVNMIAPPTFGGTVQGTPSGTVYTGVPGAVVAVQYQDVSILAALGFTAAANGGFVNNVGSVTVGSSPFTLTNSNGYTEDVVIAGGTVSAVGFVRNSTTVALIATTNRVTLSPGDKAVVTYSAAPTMTSIPR